MSIKDELEVWVWFNDLHCTDLEKRTGMGLFNQGVAGGLAGISSAAGYLMNA